MLHQMPDKMKKTGDEATGDISGDIGELGLSQMSLNERARLAALIELDGDETLRSHLLGAIGRTETGRGARGSIRELPSTWTIIHVLDRMEEAFEILAGMPMATRPKQYGNAMPAVQQQRLSFKDQLDMMATGELEQMAEDRNRVRLAATSAQVSRMDQALSWPVQYLADRPEQAKAVSLRALWAAMHVDIRKRCERRGIDHAAFNARWQEGTKIIAATLIARRVPVS
jgi:hypothetical protein